MKHVKLRNHFMTAPLQCNELYIEAKIFSLFLFSEVGQCSSSSSFWACLLTHLSYTQAVKKKHPLSQTQLHFLEVKKQIIKSIMADKIICPWKKYHHVSFTMHLTLRTLSVIWLLFLYLPLWQIFARDTCTQWMTLETQAFSLQWGSTTCGSWDAVISLASLDWLPNKGSTDCWCNKLNICLRRLKMGRRCDVQNKFKCWVFFFFYLFALS